jgi:predicted DNA-binding transcriptional regulator YafY
MNIYKYINRLERLHTLLKRKATGTPVELAQKLELSERQTLEYMRELKDIGIPIAFCKHQKTYYYEKEVVFNFEFRILNPDELQNLEGGRSLCTQNFFQSFF